MYSTWLCLHDPEWSFVPSNIESCLTRIRCDVLTKSSSRKVPIWSSPGVYTWMFPCELMCFFSMCWNVCARENQASFPNSVCFCVGICSECFRKWDFLVGNVLSLRASFPVIGPSLMNIQTSDKERSHKQSWSQLVSRRRERVGADFPMQNHVHVCLCPRTLALAPSEKRNHDKVNRRESIWFPAATELLIIMALTSQDSNHNP